MPGEETGRVGLAGRGDSLPLVGSDIWHLELIDDGSMATSSCGIVNRLSDWKDEREPGLLLLCSTLKRSSWAGISLSCACAEVRGSNRGEVCRHIPDMQ